MPSAFAPKSRVVNATSFDIKGVTATPPGALTKTNAVGGQVGWFSNAAFIQLPEGEYRCAFCAPKDSSSKEPRPMRNVVTLELNGDTTVMSEISDKFGEVIFTQLAKSHNMTRQQFESRYVGLVRVATPKKPLPNQTGPPGFWPPTIKLVADNQLDSVHFDNNTRVFKNNLPVPSTELKNAIFTRTVINVYGYCINKLGITLLIRLVRANVEDPVKKFVNAEDVEFVDPLGNPIPNGSSLDAGADAEHQSDSPLVPSPLDMTVTPTAPSSPSLSETSTSTLPMPIVENVATSYTATSGSTVLNNAAQKAKKRPNPVAVDETPNGKRTRVN